MPQIYPMMTEQEIEQGIEQLIEPENADGQVAILVRFLYEVANFEESRQADQAKAIALAAFRQTTRYERLVEDEFQKFVRDAHREMPAAPNREQKETAVESLDGSSTAVH